MENREKRENTERTMRMQSDMIRKLAQETRELRSELDRAREDNDYLKKVLFLAMGRRTVVIRNADLRYVTPTFEQEENIEGDLILRAIMGI